MPKVTLVEPQKKNLKRFNIFLDGIFAFGADEDTVVTFRLIPGKIIDEELLSKILFETETGKLMENMYRLFNIRQRSEKEVRDYLKNLSFKRKVKDQEEISSLVIENLINRLKQKQMLDDEIFARSWIQSRRKSKSKGKVALKSELMQKGINKEIIDELMTQTVDEDEQKLARRTLEKKLKIWKNLPVLDFKRKAIQFLLRKGFEYTIVVDVIEKILQKGYNNIGESLSWVRLWKIKFLQILTLNFPR